MSDALATPAHRSRTMNDVAIVKEGWLHKRGQCPRGLGLGPGSGAGLQASFRWRVLQWPRWLSARPAGWEGPPGPAQVSVQGPVSPMVCRAWPCETPWAGDMRSEAQHVACPAGGEATAWLGLVGREATVPPSLLSWKAVRTLGLVQGLAHWRPGALPEGSAGQGRAGRLGLSPGCGTCLCWSWLTLVPSQPPLSSRPQPCAQGGARAGAVGMGAEASAPHLPALPTACSPRPPAQGGWTGLDALGESLLLPQDRDWPVSPLTSSSSRPVPSQSCGGSMLTRPLANPSHSPSCRWRGGVLLPTPGHHRLLRGGSSKTDGADGEVWQKRVSGTGFCGMRTSSPVEQGSGRSWGGRQRGGGGETRGCREHEAGGPGCGQLCF